MKQLSYYILITFLISACQSKSDQQGFNSLNSDTKSTNNQEYYDYATETANKYIDSLDGYLSQWRENNGFDEAGNLKTGVSEVYLAALLANLYEITGDKKYILPVKKILLQYNEYRELAAQPEFLRPEYKAGIPPIPNFFLPPKFARAAIVLFDAEICTKEEKKKIQTLLAETADYLMVTQEWGPMNRAVLRAEGLLLINKALHYDYPRKLEWEIYALAILTDNLREWSIEDAGMYNMIWMYSLCGIDNYYFEETALNEPRQFLYFEYLHRLFSPAGVIPDFGDARWRGWWSASIPVMECGAKVFNKPEYKWMAKKSFEKNLNPNKQSIDLALKLSEAIIWGNKELSPKQPTQKSDMAYDGTITKKLVFRNGWEDSSTYLLYNFKDQGTHGAIFKDNLRNTLSVDHEKMHHGHNDEQSIAFWMHNGSVLLRDGGYRPSLPSGPNGEYRADIFHNKMVFRLGPINTDNGVISTLKNKGHYQASTTQKIDFITSYNDYSRTAETIDNKHIKHERIINYLKNDGVFIVFDIVKSLKEKNTITAANLWHTQNIIDSSSNWYLTNYKSIGKWQNTGNEKLLLIFPETLDKTISTDNIERHHQKEKCIAQTRTVVLNKGETECFITVLVPVGKEDYTSISENYESLITNTLVGIRAIIGDKEHYITHKINLEQDIERNWPRPKYTYNAGKISAFGYESDASHFYVKESKTSTSFYALNCTKFIKKEKVLFEQMKNSNEFRPDNDTLTADAWKVRRVEKVLLK